MDDQKTQLRQQRGQEIARTSRIVRTERGWKVPSQSGHGSYLVVSRGFQASCDCPDYEIRRDKCKHIWAVHYKITQEFDKEGNLTAVTETKTVRKTYPQDWKNYNLAQTKEKGMFMRLLADLTSKIRSPAQTLGRPQNPYSDMIYAMVFKTYSTFSGRRFMTDMENSQENL